MLKTYKRALTKLMRFACVIYRILAMIKYNRFPLKSTEERVELCRQRDMLVPLAQERILEDQRQQH